MNVYDRFLIAFGFLAVGTRLTWLIASFLLLLIVGIADHAIPRTSRSPHNGHPRSAIARLLG